MTSVPTPSPAKFQSWQSCWNCAEALAALKGPMGNVPAFRKHLQSLLSDEAARERLASELNLVLEAPKASPDA